MVYNYTDPSNPNEKYFINTEDISQLNEIDKTFSITLLENKKIDFINLKVNSFISSDKLDKALVNYSLPDYNIESSIQISLEELCQLLISAITYNELLSVKPEIIIEIINKHFSNGEIVIDITDKNEHSSLWFDKDHKCKAILYNSHTNKIIGYFNNIAFSKKDFTFSKVTPISKVSDIVYDQIIAYIPEKDYYYIYSDNTLVLDKVGLNFDDPFFIIKDCNNISILKEYSDKNIIKAIEDIYNDPKNAILIMNQYNSSRDDFEFEL